MEASLASLIYGRQKFYSLSGLTKNGEPFLFDRSVAYFLYDGWTLSSFEHTHYELSLIRIFELF